jgi:hypothetical protein
VVESTGLENRRTGNGTVSSNLTLSAPIDRTHVCALARRFAPPARLVWSDDSLDGWPSGLRRTPGKCVYVKAYRGFESHPVRSKRTTPHSLGACAGFRRNWSGSDDSRAVEQLCTRLRLAVRTGPDSFSPHFQAREPAPMDVYPLFASPSRVVGVQDVTVSEIPLQRTEARGNVACASGTARWAFRRQ